MDYTIYPYEGVGPIRLGMTQQEIRTILGEPEETVKKVPSSEYPLDYYVQLGIQVFYKKPWVCDSIEMVNNAKPTFQGQSFFDRPYSDLKRWFRQIDNSVEIENSGLTSYTFGIALYAPHDEEIEPTKSVTTVFVFERGLYDGFEEKMLAMETELKRRIDAGLPFDDLLMGY
jgi:hypothetical protein